MEFEVIIDNFSGPMDLLLNLVKETKLDIYEISMHEIIDKYLEYIKNMENLNIDVSSSFLVMASTLVHLKSKKLIGGLDKEEDTLDDELVIESEEDLREKIIMYEQYKKVTSKLQQLEEKRQEVHTKLPENLKEYEQKYSLSNEDNLTADDLYKALQGVLERLHYKEPKNTKITKREISIASRKLWIRKKLENTNKCLFDDLFEVVNKDYIIATFLAVLEMSKERNINITQEKTFSKIWVWRVS